MRRGVQIGPSQRRFLAGPFTVLGMCACGYVVLFAIFGIFLMCTLKIPVDDRPIAPDLVPLTNWLTAGNVLWIVVLIVDLRRLLTGRRRGTWAQLVTTGFALVLIGLVETAVLVLRNAVN